MRLGAVLAFVRGRTYNTTNPITTGTMMTAKTTLFSFALCAAKLEITIIKSWTAPKGMLSSEVVYLSKLRPRRIRGPKTLETAAPTFKRSAIENQRYVFGSMKTSTTCDHLNSRDPIPVLFARRRSIPCSRSCSVRKRAVGTSLSSFQYTNGAVMTVTRPTKRKILI